MCGTRGIFPTLPVMWTKSSSQSQQEDMMLKLNQSLIDLDLAGAQLTAFESNITCFSFRDLFDLFVFCRWTAVFLQNASAEYTDIQ